HRLILPRTTKADAMRIHFEKSENRMSKSETNSKSEIPITPISTFEFVSNFDIRISGLPCCLVSNQFLEQMRIVLVGRFVRWSLGVQVLAFGQRGVQSHKGAGHGSSIRTMQTHGRIDRTGLGAKLLEGAQALCRGLTGALFEPPQGMAESAVAAVVHIA